VIELSFWKLIGVVSIMLIFETAFALSIEWIYEGDEEQSYLIFFILVCSITRVCEQ